jgi:hypothetical protein
MIARTTACALAGLALLAQPALSQEREWTLDAAGEDVFLVFGVPQTDDVGLSFWCKIGSSTLSVFYPVTWTDLAEGASVKLRMEAGTLDVTLRGKATAGAESGGSSIEAPLPIDSKLVAALSSNDRITLKLAGHKGVYPLAGANVDELVRLCRGP